jgi:hypothetical protein
MAQLISLLFFQQISSIDAKLSLCASSQEHSQPTPSILGVIPIFFFLFLLLSLMNYLNFKIFRIPHHFFEFLVHFILFRRQQEFESIKFMGQVLKFLQELIQLPLKFRLKPLKRLFNQ